MPSPKFGIGSLLATPVLHYPSPEAYNSRRCSRTFHNGIFGRITKTGSRSACYTSFSQEKLPRRIGAQSPCMRCRTTSLLYSDQARVLESDNGCRTLYRYQGLLPDLPIVFLSLTSRTLLSRWAGQRTLNMRQVKAVDFRIYAVLC